VVLALGLLTAERNALAQEAERQPAYDIELKNSARDLDQALSSSDCITACQALGSMRRAAERICKLVPGPPCDKANARVEESAKKVREACPTCATAFAGGAEKPERAEAKPAPQESVQTAGGSANAPPAAERGRGGCASCDVTGGDVALDPTAIALVLWAFTRRSRRSKKSASAQ